MQLSQFLVILRLKFVFLKCEKLALQYYIMEMYRQGPNDPNDS